MFLPASFWAESEFLLRTRSAELTASCWAVVGRRVKCRAVYPVMPGGGGEEERRH